MAAKLCDSLNPVYPQLDAINHLLDVETAYVRDNRSECSEWFSGVVNQVFRLTEIAKGLLDIYYRCGYMERQREILRLAQNRIVL